MKPKDLKIIHEKKQAEEAAANAKLRADSLTFHQRLQDEASAGRTALREVVIPYLEETQKELGKQVFTWRTAEISDSSPVAVAFRYGRGAEFRIETSPTGVRVSTYNPHDKSAPIPKPLYVYPATAEPFIGKASDLVEEKIGALIKIAIEGR